MEWSSIRLDAHTVTEVIENPDAPTAVLASLLPPQVAPMHLRVMAAVVDGLLVASGFVLFAGRRRRVAGSVPAGAFAGIIAGVTLALLYLCYQGLFFTSATARRDAVWRASGCARFQMKTPRAVRCGGGFWRNWWRFVRLGIGVLWMLLDDDRLGWHDRISRMYQRAY